MMNTNGEIPTATDVIRWVYLARMNRQRGNHESARRWQAKADAWLERTRVEWRHPRNFHDNLENTELRNLKQAKKSGR